MEQTFLLTAARKAMLVAFFATVPAFSLPSLADTVKSVNIQQQAGKVKGQVFDSNGEPVIGASVKIVGRRTVVPLLISTATLLSMLRMVSLSKFLILVLNPRLLRLMALHSA